LSKRDGVTSIDDFKNMGYVPSGLVNYMSLLGWTPPDATQELFLLSDAAKEFSFDRVNKAGAKFDWDKLNWINSQYIHKMSVPELTDLLMPYWENAGYDLGSERAFLESLTTLVGQSLNRLDEVIGLTEIFFKESLEYKEEAKVQLQQETAKIVIQGLLEQLEEKPKITVEDAQEIIKRLTKDLKLKKGMVLKPIRCALTGDVHGPDLVQTWVLLNQKGWDKSRLESALI
ncbi:MAG TPA: glutamate--tRNA ligase family protein, partial [Allocoleopsis sp.]